MTYGTIATLPELIALKQCAQKKSNKNTAKSQHTGHRDARLRGRGMDFAEVRNYQAGDEIRHMDWRSTARTGRPHIKLYEEERERPIILLVDFNPSMHFGTRHMLKSVLAAQLAALLAWQAVAEGDKIGSILFSGSHLDEHRPKGRLAGVLPLLNRLSQYTKNLHQAPDIEPKPLNDVLRRLKQLLKPGSLLVLISDFYSLNDASKPLLKRLKKHNDCVAYHIADVLELSVPEPGVYPITNHQKTAHLDLRHQSAQAAYLSALKTRKDFIQTCFKQLNVPYFSVTSESDWIQLAKDTFPRSLHG